MTPFCPNGIVHVPRRFVAEEWGGTETVILEISRQQQRAGLEPVIMTSMALAKQRSESIGGVPVKRYPYCYPFFGLSADDKAAMDKKGGNLLSLSFFAALLRERGVRLFHAHALKRLGGEVRTAARLRKKPFVVSLHGGVFDVPTAELGTMLKPIENKTEWGKPFGAIFGSILSSSAPWDDLKFNWEGVGTINRAANILWNVYRFPVPYMILTNSNRRIKEGSGMMHISRHISGRCLMKTALLFPGSTRLQAPSI